MTKEALSLAYMDIVDILQKEYPSLKNKAKLYRYADEILKSIDWDNEILMHKGLKWIAMEYMKKRVCFDAM